MRISLIITCFVLAVSTTAWSQDRIYWGNQNLDNIGKVNASDLASPSTVSISPNINPSGLAYYHTNGAAPLFYFSSTILYKNDLTGTSSTVLTTSNQFNRGVAIDYVTGKFYWVNSGLNKMGTANLDGTGQNETFISGLSSPWDIEVDPVNRKVYWTEDIDGGAIKRANLNDGSQVETVVSNIRSLGIAIDPLRNKIYYTSFPSGKVYSANINGTNSNEITGLSAVADIDFDIITGKLFMVDYGTKILTKADSTGSNKLTITADGTFITYADVTAPSITSIVRQTPSTATVFSGASATFRVTFSEPVLNVNAADFELSGSPTGNITVNLVSLQKVFDVTINNITNTGTLDLNVSSSHNIIDFGGNAFNGTISAEETFTVMAWPTPTITSFTPTSATIGSAVSITGTNFHTTPGENIVKFNGVLATVTASTATSITAIIPDAATTGTITVTVYGKTGTSTGSFTVFCKPTIARNANVLTSSTNTGNQWMKDNVAISGATEKNYTVTEPGNYVVRYTSSTCSGDSDPVTVTVAELTPAISQFTPTSGSVGTTVTITGTNFSTSPANNVVTFNATTAVVAASTTTSLTVTVPSAMLPGAATIGVTVNGRKGTSATNFTVTCVNPAKPNITVNGAILTSSSESNNQWLKNGVEISGAVLKSYEVTASGAYAVRVTTNGCSSESDPVTMTITGMEETFSSAISIYPNPCDDVISIHAPPEVAIRNMEIYSTTGVRKELLNVEGSHDVDVSQFSNGIYIVLFYTNKGKVIKKFHKR